MIDEKTIEQVKASADIIDVVADYTSLKKVGTSYKGLCPFHEERTPSFVISNGLYHCFGCGEGGDVISFIQKKENLSYIDAIQFLAKRYNIIISESDATAQPTTFTQAPKAMREEPTTTPYYIPADLVSRSRSDKSSFVKYLLTIFDKEAVKRVADLYKLGLTRDGCTIFWLIDEEGRAIDGQCILYDNDGHRERSQTSDHWVYSRMKQANQLPSDAPAQPQRSLFGQHLLRSNPAAKVIIVEAPKTAIIGAICMPDYIWLSCYGKGNFNPAKWECLKDRQVLVYPDNDAFQEWKAKAQGFENYCISDYVLKHTDEPKADISDILLQEATERTQKPQEATTTGTKEVNQQKETKPQTEQEKNLQQLIEYNPLVGVLVNKLDLMTVN